jgi:SAM-dependent methyltransferase
MVCRLCGGQAAEFSVRGTVYGECAECSYIGLHPERFADPAAEEARYRLHRNSYDDERYKAWIGEFLEAVERFLGPGARILDFGSGPEPVPARLLADRGFRVAVYDPFFAPGDAWKKESWDAILLHEVAEHLYAPGPTLSELAGLLVPGGALCVRTRFAPLDMAEFPLWRYRMDETHVGFFTERSFEVLASRLGLGVALLARPDRAVLVRRG